MRIAIVDRRFDILTCISLLLFALLCALCVSVVNYLDITTMGFVTPALLGGAALIAVPIVLHLIMRREAQQLQFPALRFVQQRRTMNQHRLRLRHWLLLALRCAIIALLAFALARPTLRGSGAAGKEDAPVASGAGVR